MTWLALALLAQEDVDILISRLSDESIEVRDEAAGALYNLPPSALPRLEKALAATSDRESRVRLEDVVARLRCPAQGGALVDGLRLHLSVETRELRMGGELRAKVTLWNVTRVPRRLSVGYSTCGNYFEAGTALRVAAPGQTTPGELKCHVMMCGTGAHPLEETIPPYGSKAWTLKATLESSDGRSRYMLRNGLFSIQAPEGAAHVLRIEHHPRHAPEDVEPGARPWSGRLESNPVELKILP